MEVYRIISKQIHHSLKTSQRYQMPQAISANQPGTHLQTWCCHKFYGPCLPRQLYILVTVVIFLSALTNSSHEKLISRITAQVYWW